MGGSSKKVTVGYKFYLGMHLVLCHGPIDWISRLRCDKRTAWLGNSDGTSITLNNEGLFGGESREGGVSGTVDLEFGGPTQTANSYLTARLGADVPGFRGVVSAIFRQTYLGMNYYLKPWDFRATRIHTRQNGLTQWYDAKSEIVGSELFDPVALTIYPTVAPPVTYSVQDTYSPGASALKTVGMHIYGTIELKNYIGSTQVAGPIVQGGVPAAGDYNIYTLTISSPSASYYLNNGTESGSTVSIDETINVRINAGATITLAYDLVDTASLGGQVIHADVVGYLSADMNPAHIIRECLTDPDWGMGYPEADIDDTSFTAAADALYTEEMGISLLWDRQMPIEDFINEIVKHIAATLYIDRTSGKFVLKLIRDDYVLGSLLTLDESNISRVADYSRVDPGEAINTVIVNYWDTITGEPASVTADDPAMIQMHGSVIATTIQYPGFTNSAIARKAAERDLKALSSPLLSCTIIANREASGLNIGDAFKFEWPDYHDGYVVMRVMQASFGNGKTNDVKLVCSEDVFFLPETTGAGDEAPGWEDPVTEPEAVENQGVIETPYYELVQQLGQTDVDNRLDQTPEIGYLEAFADRPGSAINAQIWVDNGAGYTDIGTIDFCATARLSADVTTKTQTSFSTTNEVDTDVVAVGSYGIINAEFVRIDAIETGTVTVGRGCLDSVPTLHDADDILYFIDGYEATDGTEYVDSEEIDVKITPNTGLGSLPVGSATEMSVVMDSRAIRPYPPGKLMFETVPYDTTVTYDDPVTIAWVHRDRTQQTGADIVDTLDDSIGPEAGTTYNLRIYDENETLIVNQTGLSGTSYDWTPPYSTEGDEYEPDHLIFTKEEDQGYLDFLPDNLVDANETFASDTGQFTKYSEGTPGTTALVSNTYEITHSGVENDIIALNTVSFTMPQIWTEIEVDVTDTRATSYDNGGVGIVKDANNFLFASMDRLASLIRVQIKISGSNNFLATVAQTFGTGFKLGMALVANSVTVWVDTGSGWVYKTGADVTSYYNFKTSGNLTNWNPGFTLANGGGDSVWQFSSFNIGRYGGVGIRDQTLVTEEDGTPYRPTADTIMFTATVPDYLGVAFLAVFTMDLRDYTYEMDAVLMVDRSSVIQNDLNGHIIYYSNGDRRIVIATWGNGFGGTLEVLHKLETTDNLLSGTHVVSSMTALSLPNIGAGGGAYDPYLVYDDDNTRWLLAYTITDDTDFVDDPFYAAAAYSTNLTSWTSLGADSSNTGYEGTKILFANDAFFIMAGGPAGDGDSSRIYSATMTYIDSLNLVFEGGTSTQPHPMIFPYGDIQICLTFDDTKEGTNNFTWGNLQIFEAPRYIPATLDYRIELESVRDGYTSFQKHDHTITLSTL